MNLKESEDYIVTIDEMKQSLKELEPYMDIQQSLRTIPGGLDIMYQTQDSNILTAINLELQRIYTTLHAAVVLFDQGSQTSEQVKDNMFDALGQIKDFSHKTIETNETEVFTSVIKDISIAFLTSTEGLIRGMFNFDVDPDIFETEIELFHQLIDEACNTKQKDALRLLILRAYSATRKYDADDIQLESAVYELLSMHTDEDLFTETYIGKTSNLLEAEGILQSIVDAIKLNHGIDMTNHPLNKKFEKCLEKEFGVKEVIISWTKTDVKRLGFSNDKPSDLPYSAVNAYTLPGVDILFRSPEEIKRPFIKKNERYYDKAHSNVIIVTIGMGFASFTDLTASEMLATILHEIGHNFDCSIYRMGTSVAMLIDMILNPVQWLSAIDMYVRVNGKRAKISEIFYAIVQMSATAATDFLHGFAAGRKLLGKFDQAFAKLEEKIPYLAKVEEMMGRTNQIARELVGYAELFSGYLYDEWFLRIQTIATPIKYIINNGSYFLHHSVHAAYVVANSYSTIFLRDMIVKKKEIFADTFAATYGYGPDLITALDKLNKQGLLAVSTKLAKMYPTTTFMMDLGLATNELNAIIFTSDHGTTLERAAKIKQHLKKQLQTYDFDDPRIKQELTDECDRVVNMVDSFVKEDSEKGLYLTAGIHWVILHIFGGNTFLYERLFPDVRA